MTEQNIMLMIEKLEEVEILLNRINDKLVDTLEVSPL